MKTAFGTKEGKDVLIDFGIGQFKSLGKNSFKMLGGNNSLRDNSWDIGVGLYKTESKKLFESIKQNQNKSKDGPTL